MAENGTFTEKRSSERGGMNLKSSMKKIAGFTVTLLLLTAMMPIMAFAKLQWGNDVKFRNNTVSGSVYVSEDVYGNIAGPISIAIKNDRGVVVDVVYAEYDRTVNGSVYYTFERKSVTRTTYVDLVGWYFDESVNEDVYSDVLRVRRIGSGGGGGGGGSGSTISAARLQNAFAANLHPVITISGYTAVLPASALINAPEGATLTIENSIGSYTIVVHALDYEALAEEVGVPLNQLYIVVTIAPASGDDAEDVSNAVEEAGGTSASRVVEFNLQARGGAKTTEISDFGNTYFKRTIKNVTDEDATVVLYNDGELSFIPSTVNDGVATLYSTTNSLYTVVSFDKSFPDTVGHWSESYVKAMANRLIVEGYEDGTFGPDRNVTRAEFATLIVRALGLEHKQATANFSDVSSRDWFANAVGVAAQAGIIKGYEDGTFRPNEVINREELAAMVVRASAFAGKELSGSTSSLARFQDAGSIVWAEEEIAAAVNAGIINGYEDGTVRPRNTATRAEASTMLQRFLANVGFIND